MDRTKLLQNPLPVDRVAARVVKPARAENLWRPMPKDSPTRAFSTTALETAPIPHQAPKELHNVVGMRRDRLVIVGYARRQGVQKQGARWVVRCDCGNYEHRNKILRWLGTAAPDMCVECRARTYKRVGEWSPKDAAERAPISLGDLARDAE